MRFVAGLLYLAAAAVILGTLWLVYTNMMEGRGPTVFAATCIIGAIGTAALGVGGDIANTNAQNARNAELVYDRTLAILRDENARLQKELAKRAE